jgi:hypothetical protein
MRLLEEFASVLPDDGVATPFDGLEQYWQTLELKFSVRSMVVTGA